MFKSAVLITLLASNVMAALNTTAQSRDLANLTSSADTFINGALNETIHDATLKVNVTRNNTTSTPEAALFVKLPTKLQHWSSKQNITFAIVPQSNFSAVLASAPFMVLLDEPGWGYGIEMENVTIVFSDEVYFVNALVPVVEDSNDYFIRLVRPGNIKSWYKTLAVSEEFSINKVNNGNFEIDVDEEAADELEELEDEYAAAIEFGEDFAQNHTTVKNDTVIEEVKNSASLVRTNLVLLLAVSGFFSLF